MTVETLKYLPLCLLLYLVTTGMAGAADFRTSTRIATPERLPEGARPLRETIPVDRSVVEKAVKELYDAYSYNPAKMEKLLSEDFLDRSRLLDSMREKLPRDARLRVLGIRSVQTLGQYLQKTPGGGEALVSTVTATVLGQLQFNDPVSGFQRLQGTSEYLLRVRQKIE